MIPENIIESRDQTQTSGDAHTFFYVFAHPIHGKIDRQEQACEEKQYTSDCIAHSCFQRFKCDFKGEATVIINPKNYHWVRQIFGISSLPAFGVSRSDLEQANNLNLFPPKIPAPWNLLKRKEREQMLESEVLLLKVEREILSKYESPDRLYQFVRDLHICNLDHGLASAAKKIEREAMAIGGKKLLSTTSVLRKAALGI